MKSKIALVFLSLAVLGIALAFMAGATKISARQTLPSHVQEANAIINEAAKVGNR